MKENEKMDALVVAKPKLPEIKFDFDTAKTMLENDLVQYKNLVVTEDTIPACKNSRADLNKLKKSIDDTRKEIKKFWNEPLSVFEGKITTLKAMCDSALEYLDDGLSKYEVVRVAEKTRVCKDLLTEKIADSELDEKFAEQVTLPEGFANKGMTIKSITTFLDTKIINLTSEQNSALVDVKIAEDHITAMNEAFKLTTPFTKKDFAMYFEAENFALSFLLSEISSRARSRGEAETKATEVAKEKVEEKEVVEDKMGENINPSVYHFTTSDPKEKIITYTINIKCTATQFNSISSFLTSNRIQFAEVDDF